MLLELLLLLLLVGGGLTPTRSGVAKHVCWTLECDAVQRTAANRQIHVHTHIPSSIGGSVTTLRERGGGAGAGAEAVGEGEERSVPKDWQ